MKQKIIDEKKYAKQCANCFFGRMPKDKNTVLCEKNGVVDPQSKCRHYKYDPLRRVPDKIVINSNYTEDDFKL